MALLCWLLLLESWPVGYAQQLLERLGTYDLLRLEAVAEVGQDAVAVRCRLVLQKRRPGPVRFLLTPEAEELTVLRAGRPVPARTVSFEGLLRAVAPGVRGAPVLVAIEAPPEGRDELELRYTWRPRGTGLWYVRGGNVQTHLSSFWLPAMEGQLFEAELTVLAKGEVAAPGRAEAVAGGWRFRPERPVQVLAFTAGRYRAVRRGGLTLLLPPGLDADAGALLDDLEAVLATLGEWFGEPPQEFRLVVEADPRPAPSYCGGEFAVIDRRFLPAARGRRAWLRHLAHECAHLWFGHRLASPAIGEGGTWLREGLAQWCSAEVLGAVEGAPARRTAWRADFRRYVSRLDLRRSAREAGVLFANEPTLLDATYLDDSAVAYLRGALVHRRLAAAGTPEAFRARLRRLAEAARGRLATAADYARVLGAAEAVAYYAGTTRLPDLMLTGVDAKAGRAAVECRDPLWPGGRVPVHVTTAEGVQVLFVNAPGSFRWRGRALRIEVDPERVHLDPIRSNNLWEP